MRAGGRLLQAAAGVLLTLALSCGLAGAQARTDVEYIVPVVALAREEGLQPLVDRLWEARIPYYVAPIATAKGLVYRLRVGPFADRAEAERMRARLKGMGFDPSPVTEMK